ncbi:MAG: isoprenylcysteine carboxylmethyltransferase family protein [Candidatus Dormibacteraeota bacterium]|nr:isoprenylcysteine carboxylmethyltransferase family protein [Candidatus Dormibacteraeota bacterium]
MSTSAATAPSTRHASLDSLRLRLFGQLVPATFFALLGYMQLMRVIADARALPHPVTVGALLGAPVPASLYLLFCAIPVFIYVGRPAPRARDGRLLPRAAGLVGTTMLLVVGALPQNDRLYTPPSWAFGLSTATSIVAFGLAVYGLLYLRRSLSLIPEARRLVTGGPYRVVRHPLYGAEILASVAFAAVNPAVLAVIMLVPFVLVQLTRARFEERLLSGIYPQYAVYAAHTKRLIPFIW